jgi:glycogen debranching enzyme
MPIPNHPCEEFAMNDTHSARHSHRSDLPAISFYWQNGPENDWALQKEWIATNGVSGSIRPNQLFSFSLRYPVLQQERWASVFAVVERDLLTPHCLPTLSPDHPDYRPNYYGASVDRDAAYHPGTIWPWLIGHYLDAAVRVHRDVANLARALVAAGALLQERCLGQINEIFDADPTFLPRGCVAQAWNVAEILRGLVRGRNLCETGKQAHGAVQ